MGLASRRICLDVIKHNIYQFVHVGNLFLLFYKTDNETTNAASINTSLDIRDHFAILRGLALDAVVRYSEFKITSKNGLRGSEPRVKST